MDVSTSSRGGEVAKLDITATVPKSGEYHKNGESYNPSSS